MERQQQEVVVAVVELRDDVEREAAEPVLDDDGEQAVAELAQRDDVAREVVEPARHDVRY